MPFFVPYCLVTGRHLATLRQRFGLSLPDHVWRHSQRLWIHAASVGEVQAAKALITALNQPGRQADYIVTTVTEQGQRAAQRQLGGTALCLYAPIDLPWVIERFIRELQPTMYLCLETELWPNMLRLAKVHDLTTMLLNGRLSARSLRRYGKMAGFIRQVLNCFDRAAVIQEVDRQRYLALGLASAKIEVCGNAKYDLRLESILADDWQEGLTEADLRQAVTRRYRARLGLGESQPVLLAGSTHSGEEAIILTVFAELTALIPDLVLVIAPRHLDRLEQLTTDWRGQGLGFQAFSQLTDGQRQERIILVDEMGELARLYAVATYVFCGGSLVERGGHNIMEPALWGKPPFYGPHMNDFADARALLEGQEAGFVVKTGQELVAAIASFHEHPEAYRLVSHRALAVAAAQQGAAAKQTAMVWALQAER